MKSLSLNRPRSRAARLLILAAALVAPAALSAQEVGVHLSLPFSPVYGGAWDPAFTGAGLALRGSLPLGPGYGALAVQADIDGPAILALLPVGYGFAALDDGSWRISLEASLVPALSLNRPAPLFVGGAGGRAGFAWFWRPDSGVELSLGFRWLHRFGGNLPAAPDSWEIPISLGLVWRSAPGTRSGEAPVAGSAGTQ